MKNIFLFAIVLSAVNLLGCTTFKMAWENDSFYKEQIASKASSGDIDWEIVNNYSLRAEYFSDHESSVASLNKEMRKNGSNDIEIKRVSIESKRLSNTPLLIRQIPQLSTRHYDEGLSRYGEMITFNYQPWNIENRGLGFSLSQQQADESVFYDPLLPVRRWIVKISIDSNSDICSWKVNNDESVYQYDCDEFYLLVPSDGATVSTEINGRSYSANIEPKDHVVLALGDSYISGEGNAPWIDTRCHRSHVAWPNLLAARFAAEYPQKSISVISRACSGAKIHHVVNTPYEGVAATPGRDYPNLIISDKTPPQLESAVRDLCVTRLIDGECTSEYIQPDVILLSIGGNDANFGDVVKKTLFTDISMVESGQNRLVQSERDRLDTALNKMESDYALLADKISSMFPKSKIIATNYLNPLHASKDKLCTKNHGGGFFGGLLHPLTSFLKIEASDNEIVALQNDFIKPLVGMDGIGGYAKKEELTRRGKWYFVRTSGTNDDGSQIDNLVTNGICMGDNSVAGRWFNRVADTNRDRITLSETAHPNIYGQLFYTSVVYPTFERLLIQE